MDDTERALKRLSDDELLASAQAVVVRTRRDLVLLLKHLAEIDERELALHRAYSSMWDYCVRALKCSEGEAECRTKVAKKASRFPLMYELIESGELTLTNAYKVSLLREVCGRTAVEVDRLLAPLSEKRETERIRFAIPAPPVAPPSPSGELPMSSAPPLSQAVKAGKEAPLPAPEAPRRVQFSFWASEEMLKRYSRAKGLLWHKFPKAKAEDVFDQALKDLLDKRDPLRRLARKDAREARKKAKGRA